MCSVQIFLETFFVLRSWVLLQRWMSSARAPELMIKSMKRNFIPLAYAGNIELKRSFLSGFPNEWNFYLKSRSMAVFTLYFDLSTMALYNPFCDIKPKAQSTKVLV